MPAAAPHLSLAALGLRFLRFGALAFGGPIVQIASLHGELVVRERWVTEARFRQVLAVYQAMPGPEATELCIWFGTLARGRLGGLIAGLGFLLPGLLLMLLLSWLLFGIDPWPAPLAAAFLGMQAAVVALVVRAALRLFRTATHHDAWLRAIAITTALGALVGVPFAASLIGGGIVAAAARGGSRTIVMLATLAWLVIGAVSHTTTTAAPAVMAPGTQPESMALLASGLQAGLLTFGGAYTAIPFLQADATGDGGWMTNAQFLSGLAVGGVIPAPMVILGTWVGWAGGGLLGALLVTLGIFLPAFVLPLLLHTQLERLVQNVRVHAVLDGITAAVVGLVAAVATAMLTTLTSPLRVAVATGALVALCLLRSRIAVLPIMAAAAGVALLAS